MAATSSSDESSRSVPKNFQVSMCSSSHDGDNGNNIKKATCVLCLTKQYRFHCRNCVKNGNIVHSGNNKKNESLSEKQQKYVSVQASLKIFRSRYESLIKDNKANENAIFLINREREKVKLLQQIISKKRIKLQILSARRDELRKANNEKGKHLPRYPFKVKELGDYALDRKEKVRVLREQHDASLKLLKETTQQGIKQLVQYIFPITEIVLKDESSKHTPTITTTNTKTLEEESETIKALADAKNTSYIRGKWVFHGSGISEMQIQIVAPSLPANGDYSAYVDWLSDNKDDVPKTAANEIAPSRVNAFRIIGGLTYATQLTQLISFYLNVRLPHKLAYGDFCRKLNEEQFLRKVSRLNSNIFYIAYTQGVNLSTLNENHTLENILAILDLEKSDLGRHGCNEVSNAPLQKSVDSLLIGIIETATESESEDEHSLRLDWEAVSNLPTQQEIINSNMMTPAATQTSTITEGLFTSLLRWIK